MDLFLTGNFNENSKVYTDVTLFTSNNEILEKIKKIFRFFFDVNYRLHRYKHLIVSPTLYRSRFNKLIDREI